ncbi:Protein MON2 like [Pseudolycoriella hygida]|uniref:Protein MON2 homolog n=1 Tax=Pseudolycoriella hygida TaxID=35572 RepID=A0A9Q0S0Z7_9DIPT|nr:Protein MON2 like [Pseudolycoriella hygida]
MSFVSGTTEDEGAHKFLYVLQADFKNLGIETRKKYPQIKEACEEAITKLQSANPKAPVYYMINQILYPLIQGCDSKDLKVVKHCLGMMQRLIIQKVVDQKGAKYITDTLWMLMENSIEEVKVLQTVTLLLTTNTIVHGETLAKALVLCFRLHFTKDSTIVNTAGATVRQLVSLVFDRLGVEESKTAKAQDVDANVEQLKLATGVAPKRLRPCAADAYLLFQDLVLLVNADEPYWLLGITEMTRTFGLELLEIVLTSFADVFFKNPEFSFLLKERVCPLVIKLFSPNIKYRTMASPNSPHTTAHDKPYFPISMRLLRVVSILIQKYHCLLVTECEIFLSLIVKFLNPDKPSWQRSLALEVIHKMTVQPDLLSSFCRCYDLKEHATNIFQDIVISLGVFVQTNATHSQHPTLSGGSPVASGVSMKAGFLFCGVWFPLVAAFPIGKCKPVYLEMLDKVDSPTIPDGYGISIAYACLLDIIRSISFAIKRPSTSQEEQVLPNEDRDLHIQLVASSWCGLLAALTPLIDAATDEAIVESVLKSMQEYVALCGLLELHTARDAFVTAMCKASLPPHYALSVFNLGYQMAGINVPSRTNSHEYGSQCMSQCGENDFRHQIVAVGTPLPSLPFASQQGPVMLTAKNLQCMRALLHLAIDHGNVLGTAWQIVLTTLQHLVWILGLKPSTGGSLRATPKASIDTSAGITAIMSDLPVLSQMLSQLFGSSQFLDNEALHHLVDALCKLSREAMELAFSNREPSLFAVAKLLETGLVNLPRIEVLWRPLTSHFLEVCQHPHIRMREWGVEAITYLVKAALQFKYEKPLKDNFTLQMLLLNPLAELSSVPHRDVRHRQLECVLQVLNGAGETLSHGWPLVLGIIGAVSDHHGESLIRSSFQCLQLVVTDFLPVIPWRCLPVCVNTAAKFGSQTQELNISLTAVGLMWNISDFFNQNQEKLSQTVIDDANGLPEFPGTLNMPQFDKLWMCLFARLGELCGDPRPAVRKSAGQTLFSTVSAHGCLLNPPTWQAVLWQVLFPLLDKVRNLSNSASSEKVDTSGNILIHHSRNTAQKQWAETQVLTLSGVSRVFNAKRQLLQMLGDFPRAWSLLLEFIENSALSKSSEVSLAALKSFQEILYNKIVDNLQLDERLEPAKPEVVENIKLWIVAWRVWLRIATDSTCPPDRSPDRSDDMSIPSQAFLTTLVQIFPSLFQNISTKLNVTDLDKFLTVLANAVAIPVHSDSTPYIMSTISDSLLTPLHDSVLDCMELLQKEAMSNKNLNAMIPSIFNQLLTFSKFACVPPTFERVETRSMKFNQSQTHSTVEWVSTNYIPLGEKALSMVVKLYTEIPNEKRVVDSHILHEIIKALSLPLSLKYKCMSSTTWKAAITSLISVLKVGLREARSNPSSFSEMWLDLSETIDKFLFPSSACTMEDRGIDEIASDETFDCQVVELLRDDVLMHSQEIPRQFISNVFAILKKASVISKDGANGDIGLRFKFSKTCSQTLTLFPSLAEYDLITTEA